jgi:hypothetical protein
LAINKSIAKPIYNIFLALGSDKIDYDFFVLDEGIEMKFILLAINQKKRLTDCHNRGG